MMFNKEKMPPKMFGTVCGTCFLGYKMLLTIWICPLTYIPYGTTRLKE